jgi:hypothetical protein
MWIETPTGHNNRIQTGKSGLEPQDNGPMIRKRLLKQNPSSGCPEIQDF